MTKTEWKYLSEPVRVRHTWHGRAFILEILVVMIFVIVSIAVLAQIFALAKHENDDSTSLSYAVIIATNEAELFAANPTDNSVRYYQITNNALEETGNPDTDSFSVLKNTRTIRTEAGILYETNLEIVRHNQTIYSLTSARYVSDSEVE